ncbi:uncharacterized protein LOC127612992 isoform X2 [Hippocampus zosterae]|uniref:uncharacterized protein LOC127612992 isoform X2 n=1 Tax=Hippocampus zosterae TaxID=109293 RepID=UPI00223D0E31|nr:uncharacterized protein LOC127612992 isoform X2 [Hippocampus zosterae]
MHSKGPEYGQRPPHGDRDRRWRDEYDKRQEEKYEYHGNGQWDSYHQHGRSGPGRTERSSISTDYSYSPQKLYSKDSLVRDRDRDRDADSRSPVRGRLSSQDWKVAEKKRQRFTDDSRDAYSYIFEPDCKKYRQSPDHFPRDYKHPLPQEVRRSMQDYRIQHRHEEFTSRYHQPYDFGHRQLSTYNKAREDQGRNQSYSPERNLPQDDSKKRDVKSRERKNSSPAYGTDRARNYLDASKRQSLEDVTKPSHDAPEKKISNGFQLFLDVLNKGVDVDVLNQIVSGKGCGQPPSAASSHNTSDHPCVPGEQICDPPWKRRLEAKIKAARKDVSQLTEAQRGVMKRPIPERYIQMTIPEALETAKQRLQALSSRLKRYTKENEARRINRLFATQPAEVYSQWQGSNTRADPPRRETERYWNGIWEKEVVHNRGAQQPL